MIDSHAHVFFDELLGKAGPYGPSLRESAPGQFEVVTGGYSFGIGANSSFAPEMESRVAAIEPAGITAQVLSLSPLWLFHEAPASLAVPFLREANDLTADMVGKAPGLLRAFAALPAQDIPAAIDELHRNVERGFVGGYIGSNARVNLDDPELDDLYAAHEKLDAPLLIHSIVPGVDGPPGDPRLNRWLGNVTIGYPIEETLTVTSLILGGVLDRHPKLDVLIPHGGGAFPAIAGRIVDSLRLPGAPISEERAREGLSRLWFDTHVHSPHTLDLLLEVANVDHLVYGSNFGGWDSSSTSEVANMAELLDANARRLFRMTP